MSSVKTEETVEQIVGICRLLKLEPEELRDKLNSIYPIEDKSVTQTDNTPALPALLTREETAKYLKVDVQTVDRRRKEGVLKSVTTGRNILIPAESIKAYLFGQVS